MLLSRRTLLKIFAAVPAVLALPTMPEEITRRVWPGYTPAGLVVPHTGYIDGMFVSNSSNIAKRINLLVDDVLKANVMVEPQRTLRLQNTWIDLPPGADVRVVLPSDVQCALLGVGTNGRPWAYNPSNPIPKQKSLALSPGAV